MPRPAVKAIGTRSRPLVLFLLLAALGASGCYQSHAGPALGDAGVDPPIPPADAGTDPPPPPDPDADAGPDPGPSCPSSCEAYATPVTGTFPTAHGQLVLERAHVAYSAGLANLTWISLVGRIDGVPFTLSLFGGGANEPPIPVGTHHAGAGVAASAWSCGEHLGELSDVTLEVLRHDAPSLGAGSPIAFEARVVVADPGWDLDVTFSVDASCRLTTGS